MNFTTSSSYLENIVVKKKENTEGILDSKPQMVVSGGLPLSVFSQSYGGGSDRAARSIDSFIKIGGLSVPIGLVLRPEKNHAVSIKYNHETRDEAEGDETEEEKEGGAPDNEPEIREIDEEALNHLFNQVGYQSKKQVTRKKKVL
jgi:hypothetical protein